MLHLINSIHFSVVENIAVLLPKKQTIKISAKVKKLATTIKYSREDFRNILKSYKITNAYIDPSKSFILFGCLTLPEKYPLRADFKTSKIGLTNKLYFYFVINRTDETLKNKGANNIETFSKTVVLTAPCLMNKSNIHSLNKFNKVIESQIAFSESYNKFLEILKNKESE